MQTTISSPSNEKIKYIQSLSRRRTRDAERHFIIEGIRLLDEALRAGVSPALVLYAVDFGQRADEAALLGRLREQRVSCDAVTPALMAQLADTVAPQGILAAVPCLDLPMPDHLDLTLVVDGVSTPGNLGTLLRSAEAAGVGVVLMTAGTTDPYAPKVVRGGMGVHFRLPMREKQGWEHIRQILGDAPMYLAEGGAGRSYDDVDWTRPCALIVGSEAHGPTMAALAYMTEAIAIPMAGMTESLNAGVAGSVILFEAARQRRQHSAGVHLPDSRDFRD